MGKMIAGVQMYTLRDYCTKADDTVKTLKKVKKMGYNVIQVSGISAPTDVKELKKILDDIGLYPCSTHTSYERIVEDIDSVIEEHLILGCEAVICPGLPNELHNKNGYIKVAKEFGKVLNKMKKNRLILGYHNHGIELRKYAGKTGLEILMENNKELQAEIDLYWIQFAGGNPAEWIKKFSGRCSQLHYKDMGMVEHKQVMPPIGEGNMNWQEIVGVSKKAGVDYCIVEMDTPLIDAFKSLKISLENMITWGIKT